MVHHLGGGLLNELENDLERLVVSVENRPGGLGGMMGGGQQQQMGYGQPMYAQPGVMPYGTTVVGGVPYQQQVVYGQPQTMGMQPQMIGMQQPMMMQQQQPLRGPLAMPQYGQAYAQPVGQPVIYGGAQDASLGMQSGGQPYAAGYGQPYPQAGYSPAAIQQPYSQAQPGYAPQQQYAQTGYPQQPGYPASTQPPQQPYAQPQQAYAQPGPATQAPPPQPQSYPASPQPAPQQAYAQTPQPAYPSASRPAAQPTLAPAGYQPARSPSPQQPPTAAPAPQYASQPAYQSSPAPTAQRAYQPANPTNPSGYANNAQPGPTTVYTSQAVLTPLMPVPSYLERRDFEVRYEPTSHKVDTHHHALKALEKSAQTPEAMMAIVGSYLALKQSHESNHLNQAYRHSRPEVLTYSHTMDKLESLSTDFITHHHKTAPPAAWLTAYGAHRRHVFGTLYNSNELVRGFCSEVPGGPLALPELDTYALGKTVTNWNFARALQRTPNMNAGFSVLSQVRTVILVDDSGSMTGPGHTSWSSSRMRGGETRWSQACDLLSGLAPLVAQHSPHGIDLHFLNRVPFYSGLRTSQEVDRAFGADYPSNGTPTGQRVNDILDAYMCALRHYRKMLPLNLIVITDGEAQDEDILHWTIEHHVTKIVHRGFPAHQFGIEFVQVGDCEFATRHLEKLEEEVSRHHHKFQRDVVGVTPVTRIGTMDAEKLLGLAVSGIDARMNGYMRKRGVNV